MHSILSDSLDRVLYGDRFYNHYEDVPREVWQPIIMELFDALRIKTWEGYTCDLFEIHPYDWDAECDCGWDRHPFWKWFDRLKHSEDCIHTRYQQFERIYGCGISLNPAANALYQQKLLEWFGEEFRKHGRDLSDPNWYRGIGVVCTCDYPYQVVRKLKELKRTGEWIGHRRECRKNKPNFWYEPSDFRLWWYKYPLRGAERSHRISDEQFAEIIQHCIRYVREQA